MGFNVVITGVQAVITQSEDGRYSTPLDAVMATLKAAHDINIEKIIYDGKSCSLFDAFTGGLKLNSIIIKELTGITTIEEPLWMRFLNWLKMRYETYQAGEKFDGATNNKHRLRQHRKTLPGGSLSMSTQNHLHPYRFGRKL